MADQLRLELRSITKKFPGVVALNDVSFDAVGGEITGLIGVNGAGKSTLMNILGGIHTATSGKVFIGGKEVKINTPLDAEAHGIGFIHQEPVMFNYLTVAENIFISRLKGTINYKQMHKLSEQYLSLLGCDIRPSAIVGELPIGDRQMVEIARALSAGAKILLFDEPTASFSIKEKERLFQVIRDLKAQGNIIFFISHFLDEVEELTDKTIVLRDGKLVIDRRTKDITRAEILNNMIGGEIARSVQGKRNASGEVVMEVERLSAGKAPKDVTLQLREGEIVGIWGLMGSGRTELMRTIYGLIKADSGTVKIKTQKGRLEEIPFERVREYCGYITEDRHDDGLFLPWTIWENIAAPNLSRFVKKGLPFLDFNAQRSEAAEFSKKLNIKAASVEMKLEQLSGGNQQKVIMAKWLMRQPKVFLLDEPTRGVDVGAKAEIHKMIKQLAADGTAVMVISSEIEEISELSDRVLVLNRGSVVAEVDKDEIEKQLLMSYCV